MYSASRVCGGPVPCRAPKSTLSQSCPFAQIRSTAFGGGAFPCAAIAVGRSPRPTLANADTKPSARIPRRAFMEFTARRTAVPRVVPWPDSRPDASRVSPESERRETWRDSLSGEDAAAPVAGPPAGRLVGEGHRAPGAAVAPPEEACPSTPPLPSPPPPPPHQ